MVCSPSLAFGSRTHDAELKMLNVLEFNFNPHSTPREGARDKETNAFRKEIDIFHSRHFD